MQHGIIYSYLVIVIKVNVSPINTVIQLKKTKTNNETSTQMIVSLIPQNNYLITTAKKAYLFNGVTLIELLGKWNTVAIVISLENLRIYTFTT